MVDFTVDYDSACRGYLLQSDDGGIVAYDDEDGCVGRKPIKKLFLPIRTMKSIRSLGTISNCSISVAGEPEYKVVAIKIVNGVVYWKLSDGKFYDELPIGLIPDGEVKHG